MIHIAIIVSSLRRSGPIIVVQNLLRNIDRSQFDIRIVKLMDDEPDRSITSEFIDDGFIVHELHSSKLMVELFPSLIARKLFRILEEINPDVVHTHGYQACMIGAHISNRYKVVETLHCIAGEDFISSKGRLMGKYMLHRYFNNLRKIKAAIAISETVKKYYATRLKSLDVKRIYNGISLYSEKNTKKNIRNELGIPNSAKVFLVVGTLSHRKDPITIIHAFKKAFPSVKSSYLLFIGKGLLHETCEKEIGDDSRIKLLGWKPNVSDYYDAADYSISASHSEGFGLTFIESISAGVPVIGTDIPPFMEFYEIFKDLKQFIFGVRQEDKLAEVLRKAFDMKIDMSHYSKTAIEMFSAKTMAKNYESFYSDLI